MTAVPTTLPPEQVDAFGRAVDALKRELEAEVGPADLRYVRRVYRVSRAAEAVGRVLIHFSLEPLTFLLGVLSLWVHKQLSATEIGHTVLHGAFDRFPGEHGFRSESFRWDVPIDEDSWRRGHNQRHHTETNVAGRDPDIHFGPVRHTEHTPFRPIAHRIQLPFALLALWPNFGFFMNLHFCGLIDLWKGNGRPEQFDFIADRSPATSRDCYRRALRKFAPYYAKEYLLFPALAGPLFWKVALGNWLAATLRDVYTAATIYCGHVGRATRRYPAGTQPRNRAEWYVMQVESSNDFEVPWLLSLFCGALERQIEHHLFPKLPTPHLRRVAPRVRALCAEHGVEYRTASWPVTLGRALADVARLSRRQPVRPGLAAGQAAA